MTQLVNEKNGRVMKKEELKLNCNRFPNVLLLGNGILKLTNNGLSWDELIRDIKTVDKDVNYKLVPFAMQPEVVCGYDAEEIQRIMAKKIKTDESQNPMLERLLSIPFDAIITTNYTYEVEQVLSGGEWTEYKRKKSFLALNGNTKVNHNTNTCNLIETRCGRKVPVFHIHGEHGRKHSMILSYYSYANILTKLIDYNKKLANRIQEHQIENTELKCNSWLDYFILGNIWSVGFGLDVSEFDVWWAIERKSREKAKHGVFKGYFDGNGQTETPQSVLLDAMKAEYKYIPVVDGRYEPVYQKAILDIENNINKE